MWLHVDAWRFFADNDGRVVSIWAVLPSITAFAHKKTTAEAVVFAIYRPLTDQFFLPSYGAPPPIVGDTLVLPIVEGALPFSVWLLAGLTGVVLTGPGVVLRVAAGAGVPTGTAVFGGVAPESFGVVEGDVA